MKQLKFFKSISLILELVENFEAFITVINCNCGWLPVHLPHKIEKKNPDDRSSIIAKCMHACMLMPNIYIFDFSFVLLNGFLVRIVVFRN
jgi:hypothetical protein